MLTQDQHAQRALDFLEKADRHYAEGDQIQASEKLWGAAAQAIMAVAGDNGLSTENRGETVAVAEQLAIEHNDPLIASGFSIAGMYYHDAHHVHPLLDGDEWGYDRPIVGNLVARVLALRGDTARDGQQDG